LRAVAGLLDRQGDARARLAATARQEWRGAARETFDVEIARLAREAADLSGALRSAARVIEVAIADAIAEQRRASEGRNPQAR